MLIATHTIVGGTVGQASGSAPAALVLAFLLHFVLDAIPHYDTTDNHKMTLRQIGLVIGDFFLAVLLLAHVIRPEPSIYNPFLWGVVGGNLPDLLDNTPILRDIFRRTLPGRKFHNFHEWLHSLWPSPGPIPGLAVQYLLTAAALLFLWH